MTTTTIWARQLIRKAIPARQLNPIPHLFPPHIPSKSIMVVTRSGRISKSTDKVDNSVKPVVKQTRKPASKPVKKAVNKATKIMTSSDESGEGPVYFWRETDPMVGYLSQWYFCPFKDDKDPQKTYKTAEHYMMHHKALLFNDEKVALDVLKAGHPRTVKSLGRKVKSFNEATWLEHREAIVRRGNILKFTNAVTEEGFQRGTAAAKNLPDIDGSLKAMLLATGDREIVEASPFDAIWGIGFKTADAEAARDNWGLNLLGKELMEVRRVLREKDEVKN